MSFGKDNYCKPIRVVNSMALKSNSPCKFNLIIIETFRSKTHSKKNMLSREAVS